MMKRYKLSVAYNGKAYSGWQIQNNANTVEAEMRKALHVLFKETYEFYYSSRTDAGVHAMGQVVAIDVDTKIPTWKIPHAINAHLPDDIVVRKIEEVDESFHPRYGATYKTYRYKLYSSTFVNPLRNDDSYYIYKPIDIKRMEQAATFFYGEHDFTAFSSQGSSVKTSIRRIYDITFKVDGNDIEVYVTGNGFLYNMVRIMVGALVQVGIGFYEPAYVGHIIESKDRSLVKRVAPAKGLTLMEIHYQTYKECGLS